MVQDHGMMWENELERPWKEVVISLKLAFKE
jgi:hypothetical protein